MLLVLQHIACEPPGAYEDELRERNVEFVRVELDEGEPLPDWRQFEAIVAMGGPMGAYEDDLPWMKPEKALIAEAVDAGLPYWGVCLGAQLLAASLGAKVHPGPAPEVGVLSVHLTPEAANDPAFATLPAEFPALQWHSDTFELPTGATRLAYSPAYEQQAFVFRRAYALQFHLEVSSSLATEWGDVPAYAEALEGQLGPGALSSLIDQIRAREDEMRTISRRMFGTWLDQVVGISRPLTAPHTS